MIEFIFCYEISEKNISLIHDSLLHQILFNFLLEILGLFSLITRNYFRNAAVVYDLFNFFHVYTNESSINLFMSYAH